MEKKVSSEKAILENINKRKMTYTIIFILIIFSGFLLFNKLSGFTKFIKTTGEKEKKENVRLINVEIFLLFTQLE